MHSEAGRIMPGETLEESTMPDEWMAIHYGWGYITDEDYKRAQTESEDDSNLSEVTDQRDPAEEGEESAKEPVEDPVVCPDEPASSTWRPIHLLSTPQPLEDLENAVERDEHKSLRSQRTPTAKTTTTKQLRDLLVGSKKSHCVNGRV